MKLHFVRRKVSQKEPNFVALALKEANKCKFSSTEKGQKVFFVTFCGDKSCEWSSEGPVNKNVI